MNYLGHYEFGLNHKVGLIHLNFLIHKILTIGWNNGVSFTPT